MLELIVAICILLSLILYALMGGADFGGGMWDLLAVGPRVTASSRPIREWKALRVVHASPRSMRWSCLAPSTDICRS